MARKGKLSSKKKNRAQDIMKPTPLGFSPESKQFIAVLRHLESLTYKDRRRFLWHKVKPRLDRFLFKFRALKASDDHSVDRIRDIVVRSRLWLSSAFDFNDPFDMSAKFVIDGTVQEKRQRFEQLLKLLGVKWNERKRRLSKAVAGSHDELLAAINAQFQAATKTTGVYSFAGDPRSILMWSHYGCNHEGLCIVFEIARDPKLFLQAAKVEYSEEYPVVNWIRNFREGLKAMVLRKHVGWKYEQEKRLIFYDTAHRYMNFNPAALRAIIVGLRCKESTTAKLRELLSERAANYLPSVTLYRCKKHETEYKLVIVKEVL